MYVELLVITALCMLPSLFVYGFTRVGAVCDDWYAGVVAEGVCCVGVGVGCGYGGSVSVFI